MSVMQRRIFPEAFKRAAHRAPDSPRRLYQSCRSLAKSGLTPSTDLREDQRDHGFAASTSAAFASSF
jgi:hypothetical protein